MGTLSIALHVAIIKVQRVQLMVSPMRWACHQLLALPKRWACHLRHQIEEAKMLDEMLRCCGNRSNLADHFLKLGRVLQLKNCPDVTSTRRTIGVARRTRTRPRRTSASSRSPAQLKISVVRN